MMDNVESSTPVNKTNPSQYVNSFGMTVHNINAMINQDINVNKFETSSNSVNDTEDEMDKKTNKKLHYLHSGLGHFFGQINDESKTDEQRTESDTSDEEGEIDDEKYQKLQHLHSGIGHFLGQINTSEEESKAENSKTAENSSVQLTEKLIKETVTVVKYKNVDGNLESDSIVSKIGNAFNNMFCWLLPRQNKQFQPKSRLENNKTARHHSHPYKQTPKMHSPIGSTILVPELTEGPKSELRPIVIDGSNVAMCHGRALAAGKRPKFSCRGIEMCVEFFKRRGHSTIVAFLPQHAISYSPDLLGRMEKEGNVVFTPSRRVGGRRVSSYDDRFIVEYAYHHGAVIVTRDNYADLYNENPDWKKTIEEMLVMPTWVGDTLMFPADPLGKLGPSLDQLLRN